MKKYLRNTIAFLAIGLLVPAIASATVNQSPPSGPPKEPTATITNVKATPLAPWAKSASFKKGHITFLADMNLRQGVNPNSSSCFWTKPGEVWYSGGWGVDGKRFEKETTPGKLCPSRHSSTGWVKVAGGKTGRPCYNEAKIGRSPGPIAHGPIIWVKSLNQTIPVLVTAHVKVTAECGVAEASASAIIRINLAVFIRARGNLSAKVLVSVGWQASAKASARLSCVSTPPKPTVPTPKTPTAFFYKWWKVDGEMVAGWAVKVQVIRNGAVVATFPIISANKDTAVAPNYGFTQLPAGAAKIGDLFCEVQPDGSVLGDAAKFPRCAVFRTNGQQIVFFNVTKTGGCTGSGCNPGPCTDSTCKPPPSCPPGEKWNGQICAKDGTQGPGAGTPGQPGGPGAGGDPGGSPTYCKDASGNLVPGPITDSGYCPGVTPPSDGGGSSSGGPPTPSGGTCIDPATGQTRPGKPDQFGYC